MDPEKAEKLVWDHEKLYRIRGEYGNLKELSTIAEELHPRILAMKPQIEELEARLAQDHTPMTHAVVDCGVWIDGSTPTVTWIDLRPGTPRDLPIFIGGNVANTGKIVPRRFLTVFSEGAPEPFRQGSGRLELADKIVGEAGPLAARVWVNVSGLALRPAPSSYAVGLWDPGTQADAPGPAGRFSGSLRRQRLVAQMATPRDHALINLPAVESPDQYGGAGRPDEPLALEDEPTPAGDRSLEGRHSAGIGRIEADDRRAVGSRRRRRPCSEIRLFENQPRPATSVVATL